MSSLPSGRNLLGFFVSHPNAANLLMVLMILTGVFGIMRMNTQFFPTIEVPNITVTIAWPGASAEDIAANVLEATEPEVRFLDGVEEVISYARQGVGTINIEFVPNADMQKALSDVEQAVAGITTYPESSEDPVITRVSRYESVAKIAVSGPFGEAALKLFAQKVRDDLLARGIDRVSFTGMRDEEIWIEVDPQQLRRLDLTLGEIAQRIADSSRDLPSGSLEGAVERQIRSLAEAENPKAIAGIEVRALESGEKIRVGDIADVATRFERNQPIAFRNGQKSIELSIERSETTDTLTSARIVQEYMDEVVPTLPQSLEVTLYDVRAERLQQRIELLLRNGISGLALVLIILFLFLNARVAFWVAAGIPVAMMITLTVMWLTGQTINMVSLFALILTLGIIVDDAIVVGEHTATLSAQGVPAAAAAEQGALRMFLPVTAATLTTQFAFLPLFLVRDTIGQIMQAMPLVVIAVLFASLVESFLILPAHLRHGLRNTKARESRFRRAFDRGFGKFRDGPFRAMAAIAYNWRYTTVAISLAVLIVSVGLFSGGRVKFQFFPSPEAERISASVVLGAGTPESQSAQVLNQIEQALYTAEQELTGGNESLIRSMVSTLGQDGRTRNDNVASIAVQLTASEERTVRTREIVAAWRRALPKIAGVERITLLARHAGPPGRDVDVLLQGASPEVLKQASLEVRALLAQFPGISAIADDQPYGKPEIVLELTPRGTALGFTIQSAGTQVRNAFEGAIAKRFARGDEEVTVRVMQNAAGRGPQALRDLYLRSPDGRQVPLLEVVRLREKAGFSVIQRRDGKTTISVTADVDNNVATNMEIIEALRASALPDIARKYGVDYSFSGREEERAKSFSDLTTGLIAALTMIYLVLALTFASYLRPFAVMAIIPFGLVGAIWGHYLMGFPLTILSFMGLLGLAGILVNDSIILVTRVVELRNQGETLREAAINAACDRLRAVLLTSLTTIGGLLPLLSEKSLQAQFLLPIAITLVFGLGIATLLVLFIVPAFLGIGGDLAGIASRVFGRRRVSTHPAE